MTPTANVLVDGFGVIAMVAMAPVLSLMIVGAVFKRKAIQAPHADKHHVDTVPEIPGEVEFYDCLVAIVNRGLAEEANELAQEMGARGATIIHGRGSGGHDMRVFNIEVQKEKEIIFWLVDTRLSDRIANHLHENLDLGSEGGGAIFAMPSAVMGLYKPEAENFEVDALSSKPDQSEDVKKD